MKNITGSGKLPYATLVLGTEGIKDSITGFDDAYACFSFFPHSRAHPRSDENRISRTNAYPPNSLTPKKPRPSSLNTCTLNPCPRLLPRPTCPYPLRARSKRSLKRPHRPPRSRPRKAIRAWAVHQRQPRLHRHPARCRSGGDMDVRQAWVRRGRVRRHGDGVWRAQFR